ncbi:MAG: AAA family ATPase [Oscillospiraceae bacterium]|nr:AAA family ATPase [Oscillospiraceae bacterium]
MNNHEQTPSTKEETQAQKPYVIGVAGGSASGKTTFTDTLAVAFTHDPQVFHMDDYFKPEALRPYSKAPITGKMYIDDNHPDTMDLLALRRDLAAAIAENQGGVIIVEGLLTLWDEELCGLLDLKIFVDCPADERIVRRLKRNMKWRQKFDDIAAVYLDLVRYRHDEYVESTKWRADFFVNGSSPSVKVVEMLVGYVEESRNNHQICFAKSKQRKKFFGR